MDATSHSFNLDSESVDYLGKIEHSINHWSKELGLVTLRIRGLEVQLAGLYESREQFMKKAIEKAGFKADKADRINILPNGEVRFTLLSDDAVVNPE
jgi:hypothetical protein